VQVFPKEEQAQPAQKPVAIQQQPIAAPAPAPKPLVQQAVAEPFVQVQPKEQRGQQLSTSESVSARGAPSGVAIFPQHSTVSTAHPQQQRLEMPLALTIEEDQLFQQRLSPLGQAGQEVRGSTQGRRKQEERTA
jgi:hypothetical protein